MLIKWSVISSAAVYIIWWSNRQCLELQSRYFEDLNRDAKSRGWYCRPSHARSWTAYINGTGFLWMCHSLWSLLRTFYLISLLCLENTSLQRIYQIHSEKLFGPNQNTVYTNLFFFSTKFRISRTRSRTSV